MAGSKKDAGLNKTEFFKRYGISEEKLTQTGLDWSFLESIWEKHCSSIRELEPTGGAIAERLRHVPGVHSLKVRVKDAEHLIEKIIRKKLDKTDLNITPDNYNKLITDLIGVRVLHLFKDEWKGIHEFIKSNWDLHENPLAYIREGDPKELQESFKEAGCDVREHPFGYRSIHYLVKTQPTKETHIVELQVRTIFEEGWSEIDHRIRYPYASEDVLLGQFLVIFNRLAGSADEMGSFIKGLSHVMNEQRTKFASAEEAIRKNEADLNAAISKLKVTEDEKKSLQKKVDDLRRSELKTIGSSVRLLGDQTFADKVISLGALNSVLQNSISATAGLTRPCTHCKKDLFIGSVTCPHCGNFC